MGPRKQRSCLQARISHLLGRRREAIRVDLPAQLVISALQFGDVDLKPARETKSRVQV
jgi:hypothetical protein